MDAVIDDVPPQGDSLAEPEDSGASSVSLVDFIGEFGAGLLSQVRSQNPPIYDGKQNPRWNAALESLKRRPFPAQLEAVHAAATHLLANDAPAAILNAEMGTGKTMMAICVAAIAQSSGLRRSLIISPPHLVYKWRREIKETVPGARVWILNGPDTLRKLLALRAAIGAAPASDQPEFFILGRVRMRMGFHWRPAFNTRRWLETGFDGATQRVEHACCPRCGTALTFGEADGEPLPISVALAQASLAEKRARCDRCGGGPLDARPTGQATAVRERPRVGSAAADADHRTEDRTAAAGDLRRGDAGLDARGQRL